MSEKTKLEELFEMLEGMTKEYIQKDGAVTCEVSISEDKVIPTLKKLNALTKELETHEKLLLKGSHWNLYYCDTCLGHNVQHPYHVAIESRK